MAPSKTDPTYFDPVTIRDVHVMGKDMMNCGKKRLGKFKKGGTEDRGSETSLVCLLHVLLIFGTDFIIFNWFYHLLWALMFMKIYGKEADLCAHAGGTSGSVDPKTYRKWV